MNFKSKSARFIVFSLLVILAACAPATIIPLPPTAVTVSPTRPESSPTALPTFPASPTQTGTLQSVSVGCATPDPSVRFAVIGDYGGANQGEADIAGLVHGWKPDIVLTVGDNNYPDGEASTIDANVGQFFHDFIFPYAGKYGSGATENRFFPTLGNHDWHIPDAQPYLDYFSLPSNERYYDFVHGPVHFFALDSDESEPDGVGSTSVQAEWLRKGLASSSSPWNIVYFHYPPYSSGLHGSTTWMRWPFAAWGADAVLTGHDHTYERLLVDGIPYFVNGVGGFYRYNFVDILPESKFRYNASYGAMLGTASERELRFEFISPTGELIDLYQLRKP
jgi:hypothetical protein